jgi:hypothetical protein
MDNYNIKSSDFAQRANNWISDFLDELKSRSTYQTSIRTFNFYNNRLLLPKFCKSVDLIVINGRKADYDESLYVIEEGIDLNRNVGLINNPNFEGNGELMDTYIPNESIDIEGRLISEENDGYPTLTETRPLYIVENGWLKTNVDHGVIEIKYKHTPYVFDKTFALEFPLIPNEINTRKAAMFYILKTMLMRGYIHPVLNLKDPNEFVNPALAYERYLKLARIALGKVNRDAREKWTRPFAALIGKRRRFYIPTTVVSETVESEPVAIFTYRWIESSSYCEVVNDTNTGVLIHMEKEQVSVNGGTWVDTDTPVREKYREVNITACPITVGSYHMYMCVSPTDYDYENEVEIPYSNTAILNTPTTPGYAYFFISLPETKEFSLVDSMNQNLRSIMIEVGADGDRNNIIYRLPDMYATDFSTMFVLTLTDK